MRKRRLEDDRGQTPDLGRRKRQQRSKCETDRAPIGCFGHSLRPIGEAHYTHDHERAPDKENPTDRGPEQEPFKKKRG